MGSPDGEAMDAVHEATINRDTAHIGLVLHDRLILVLHERGVQLRLADRKRLSLSLRGRNRRRLKQRYQSPIGNSRQSFDQFVVSKDNIITGRLNALQVAKGERTAERDGAPRGPDGQSEISWMSQHCWRFKPIADPARRIGSEGRLYGEPIGYLRLSLSKIAQVSRQNGRRHAAQNERHLSNFAQHPPLA
jgi:hypothetical protein